MNARVPDQLDLFDWTPPEQPPVASPEIPMTTAEEAPTGAPIILVFPTDRRIGKVRDVATKLLAKASERAVDHYRRQVTEALLVNLQNKHVPPEQHWEQIRRFWQAVDCEVARRANGQRQPGGAT